MHTGKQKDLEQMARELAEVRMTQEVDMQDIDAVVAMCHELGNNYAGDYIECHPDLYAELLKMSEKY